MTKFSVRSFVVSVLALLFVSGAASAQTLPTGWSSKDIGAVAAVGAATSANNIFTVSGSGADVWGAADEFRFVYRSLTGDGSVAARVSALDMVDLWVKGGVMMRESLNANSRHASMFVSAGKGLAFQRRTTTGGSSTHTTGGAYGAPYYVKMTRTGSTFTAYKSADGVTWTKVGSTTMSLPQTIYVGLALTSHLDGTLADATFANVNVTVPQAAVAEPAPEPTTTTSTTLRVVHWNTAHGKGTDGKYNIDRIATWIAKFNPDVVTLNEVEKYSSSYGNEDQPARYAALLKAKTGRTWYYHFAQRYGNWSANGQGNVVLSRFPITSTASLDLPCDRSAGLATLDVGGRTVTVVSTHLANDSSTCRINSVAAIESWLTGFGGTKIIGGDWNATQQRSEYTNMLDSYVDVWAKADAADDAIDFAGNIRYGATHNYRIDYLFLAKSATSTAVTEARVFDTRDANGYRPSDHKPLRGTFTIK